jgi:hypothetical protein
MEIPDRRKITAGLIALVLVVAVAATGIAIRRNRHAAPAGSAQATTTATGSASSPAGAAPTTAAPTAAAGLSPLTGKPAPPGRPVLAVKIDNVRPARPQTGLTDADVVYVEPVEGGLSRIMAVFSTVVPPKVGPVRSARESDLELLAQYGRPALAFSGANRRVLAAIKSASVVDLSPNRAASAYSRTSAKSAPHNLIADPRALLRKAKGVSAAKDIGFRFAALPPGVGTATKSKVIRYGAASTAFGWSGPRKRWEVTLDGRSGTTTDGGRLEASTVVIQYTKITASKLHDVLGNTTPYTHTVGKGKALVLRDGVAIPARWSRSSATGGTTFTTTAGDELPFATGQVWVVFAAS